MEDAIFLSKFANKVRIVHRRDDFRASAIMVDRARETENIEFVTPYVVDRFDDVDEALGRAVLRNAETDEETTVDVDGAFIAIGHRPNSTIVEGQVELDDQGYVVTADRSTRTSVDGVFAAGDLVDHTYRQAVTAAGTGCMAALDAEAFLETSH
jgi:thioredoxin reductase (NADPH)